MAASPRISVPLLYWTRNPAEPTRLIMLLTLLNVRSSTVIPVELSAKTLLPQVAVVVL